MTSQIAKKRTDIPEADMFWKAYEALMGSSVSDTVKVAATQAYEMMDARWNGRMTRCTGQCCYRPQHKADSPKARDIYVHLSKPLWGRMTPGERQNTVSHEFAHAVVACAGGKSGHSDLWRRIHLSAAGNGQRCHRVKRTDLMRPRKRIMIQNRESKRCYTVTPRWLDPRRWLLIDPPHATFKVVSEFYIDGDGRQIVPGQKVAAETAAPAKQAKKARKAKPAKTKKAKPAKRQRVVNPTHIEGKPADEFCYFAARKNGGTMTMERLGLKRDVERQKEREE